MKKAIIYFLLFSVIGFGWKFINKSEIINDKEVVYNNYDISVDMFNGELTFDDKLTFDDIKINIISLSGWFYILSGIIMAFFIVQYVFRYEWDFYGKSWFILLGLIFLPILHGLTFDTIPSMIYYIIKYEAWSHWHWIKWIFVITSSIVPIMMLGYVRKRPDIPSILKIYLLLISPAIGYSIILFLLLLASNSNENEN